MNSDTSDTVEVWKDIEGYEGIYQISNTGQVKSLARKCSGRYSNREIIKKPFVEKDGYFTVGLYKDGKYRYCRVHRLVAIAFIPNPNNYPEVNHIDENKQNNNVENLEWCTTRYNLTYGHRLDCARGERNHRHKLTADQVKEIRRVYKKGDLEYGQSALGKKYGIAHGSIAAIVQGKSWKHIKEDEWK